MAFGLQPEGFQPKRLADIKSEIEASLRSAFGNEINLLPESVFGNLVGIFSERESLIWEEAESIYNSQYPDTARDTSLDLVCAITGTIRQGATYSVAEGVLLFGTVGTLIPAGSQVSVENIPDNVFETLADVTLVAGTDEEQQIAFSGTPDSGSFKLEFRGQTTNAIAYNASAATIQTELEGLSTIGTGNVLVSGTIDDITGLTINFQGEKGTQDLPLITIPSADNSLEETSTPVTGTVIASVPGVPQGTVDMSALETGPLHANAFSLNQIVTPVSGWDRAENPLDATLGSDVETDASLKARREEELQKAGAATLEAIRADLFNVTGVTAVVIFQNVTSITDIDGRPPHSVDIVVENGDEDEIAQQIFETVAAGIETIGDITKSVTDSQGFSQTIKFSRPSDVDIYLEIDLTVDSNVYPVNGDTLVENNILAYGESLSIGEDVITIPDLLCSIPGSGSISGLTPILGILDIAIRVGTAPSPTLDDNITISAREIAKFDTSRITVNS